MYSPIGQLEAPRLLRPKGIADVVVCIDCTGSMAPCIEGVKAHVRDLVAGFNESQGLTLDWRIRLVEYRDLDCNEATVSRPFTTAIAEFQAQVAALDASGGGDEPESTLDAIVAALRSDWRRGCNKCVVVFTDAPPHPTLHAATVEHGQARDVNEVINELYRQRARLFLFAPRDEVYEALATGERVEYEVVPDRTGLGGVDFGKTLRAIGKTVSASAEPALQV